MYFFFFLIKILMMSLQKLHSLKEKIPDLLSIKIHFKKLKKVVNRFYKLLHMLHFTKY